MPCASSRSSAVACCGLASASSTRAIGVAAAALQRTAGELQRHDRVDEPLLGAVVEVAHDAPALLVGGHDHARPRRLHLAQLDPRACPVGDEARDRGGQEQDADRDEVSGGLRVEPAHGLGVEEVERDRARQRGDEPDPQPTVDRQQQHAEHVQHAARHAGVQLLDREQDERDGGDDGAGQREVHERRARRSNQHHDVGRAGCHGASESHSRGGNDRDPRSHERRRRLAPPQRAASIAADDELTQTEADNRSAARRPIRRAATSGRRGERAERPAVAWRSRAEARTSRPESAASRRQTSGTVGSGSAPCRLIVTASAVISNRDRRSLDRRF